MRVSASRRSRIGEELLKRKRALRDRRCMLDEENIAGHQLGRGKSRELIVGIVPGLNADQHAERGVFKARVPDFRFDDPWRKERLRIVCIVLKNGGTKLDLTTAFGDPLAHLK